MGSQTCSSGHLDSVRSSLMSLAHTTLQGFLIDDTSEVHSRSSLFCLLLHRFPKTACLLLLAKGKGDFWNEC